MEQCMALSNILWFAGSVASIEMDLPNLGCKIWGVFGIHAVILVSQVLAFLLSWNIYLSWPYLEKNKPNKPPTFLNDWFRGYKAHRAVTVPTDKLAQSVTLRVPRCAGVCAGAEPDLGGCCPSTDQSLLERSGSTRPNPPRCPLGMIISGHIKGAFSHFQMHNFQSATYLQSIL